MSDLRDMPRPTSGKELGELEDRITARLEALVAKQNKLVDLRAWANDNPDKGCQMFAALRRMAEFGSGKHQGSRE